MHDLAFRTIGCSHSHIHGEHEGGQMKFPAGAEVCPVIQHFAGPILPTQLTLAGLAGIGRDLLLWPGNYVLAHLWRTTYVAFLIDRNCPPVGGGYALLLSMVGWIVVAAVGYGALRRIRMWSTKP